MEWFGGLGKLKKMEWNGMVEMSGANIWLFYSMLLFYSIFSELMEISFVLKVHTGDG